MEEGAGGLGGGQGEGGHRPALRGSSNGVAFGPRRMMSQR
jgi:hypothetical protein